ncbi:MAG: hypothetical protein KBA28_01120 [Syntrophaceae bacterium]|nr:hypothetical protein [Syntrophaceae bacterium]
MRKKTILNVLIILLILFTKTLDVSAGEYKLSVFNFVTMDLESSGLGTSVANSLISSLKTDASISILDRKDLETFLNLNDLQQNDQLENVVNIGSRLGLDYIVVGSVAKRGSSITVKCSLIQIDKKKEAYRTSVRAFGEAALTSEITKLGSSLIAVLTKNDPSKTGGVASDTEAKAALTTPPSFQKFPGNKKIILRWQSVPGSAASGYEVYRALNANGPFAMLGQTDRTEYQDQNVESRIDYYYRVRSYDKANRFSEFTPVLSARTDYAPNPPIILKTEGRSKSLLIVWVPSPMKSDDPSRLAGYKVYRSEEEYGSYQEVNKLSLSEVAGNDEGKISYRATALPDGQTYFYRVSSFNEKGVESELCNPIKGTTLPKIASVHVTNHLIREVMLNWTGVQSPFAVAYNIYRSLKKEDGFVRITKMKATEDARCGYSDLQDLLDYTKYYYFITIEDDLGVETSPSPVAEAVTRDIPPQPQNFAVLSGLVKKVELTWDAAKQEEVLGYNLYWSLNKDGQYQLLKKISGRENNRYTDESRGFEPLEDGRTYYYMLTAYNKVDAQSKQATAVATTKAKPKRPENVQGKYESGKVILSWLPSHETDISHYVVYEKTFTGMGKIAQVQKAEYSDPSVNPGKSKIYAVTAVNRSGLESEFSMEINVFVK